VSAHRFYISPARWSLKALTLDERESHHCVDVLRLAPGSRVVVFNGQGLEVTAEILSVEKSQVRLKPLLTVKTQPLPCGITLAQAVPKGKNMDLIIQKATELGAAKIVPLLSERTVVQVDPADFQRRLEKWRLIVVEAAKQCGQNWLPQVADPVTPKQFLGELDRFEVLLIASLQEGARSFKSVLKDFLDQHGRSPSSVLMLIGPEGDFTPAESALAKTAGCIPVTLGPIVLRAETAALFSLSVLSYELQGR